jgi:hypothetical protein
MKRSIRLYLDGEPLSEERLLELFKSHRINVLSRFIDKHFLSNDEFISESTQFMDGKIKVRIISELDKEFQVLKSVNSTEMANELLNKKLLNFIKKLYP